MEPQSDIILRFQRCPRRHCLARCVRRNERCQHPAAEECCHGCPLRSVDLSRFVYVRYVFFAGVCYTLEGCTRAPTPPPQDPHASSNTILFGRFSAAAEMSGMTTFWVAFFACHEGWSEAGSSSLMPAFRSFGSLRA